MAVQCYTILRESMYCRHQHLFCFLVPPRINQVSRVYNPYRLDISLDNPDTPRIDYYTSKTALVFFLNGTLDKTKTIVMDDYWAVRNDYQPMTNYCIKAFSETKNGHSNNSSCFYYDTRHSKRSYERYLEYVCLELLI